MSVEREVFEQIDFDDIVNQCAAVKEKRILGLKLSAEPKHFIRIIRKCLLFLISMFSLATFGHGKHKHRVYSYKSFKFELK